MQCEDAINLISARIDRELLGPDASALEEHLACCGDCRAVAQAMQLQDAQLVRGFAPGRRVAAEVADRVAAHVAVQSRRRIAPAPLLAAAAAGFLMALLLLRPWQRAIIAPATAPAETAVASIGHLDIATGPVEVLPAGKSQWQTMLTGAAVSPGSRIRTGAGVRCELAMADGSEVRLNQQSELLLKDPRQFELASGQVFSNVNRGRDPFQMSAADTVVTALGTRFDLQRRPDELVLAVVEGSTRVSGAAGEHVIDAGHVVNLANHQLGPVQASEALDRATRWIDEILILKGEDNPELNRRINDLLAQVGQEKMAFFRENELKALGYHCVEPLTRYIQSERSHGEDFKRREAARIIDDVAQPWCIPYLIELLADQDGEVRFHAAEALQRLTSDDQGRSPDQWRNEPVDAGKNTIRAWKNWWNTNRYKYPGTSRVPENPSVVG